MIMEQPTNAVMTCRIEVEDQLVEATTALFEAYDIRLDRLGPDEAARLQSGSMVTSTVGFAGDNLRGALVISTSLDFVRRLQAQLGSDESSIEAASDTMGEFSNMLLGRLKYSLLLRGVTIFLATPTTALGEHITFPPLTGCPSRWLRFDGAMGVFNARLDVSFSPEFAFAAASMRDIPVGVGDMMMF
jgi:CheY-specific phosphatase CheX